MKTSYDFLSLSNLLSDGQECIFQGSYILILNYNNMEEIRGRWGSLWGT